MLLEDLSDTTGNLHINAGNPIHPHWPIKRVLDLMDEMMRFGGGYDWKAEIEDWGASQRARSFTSSL
nr:hypothetical protein [Tanacetum cinerariifolium]